MGVPAVRFRDPTSAYSLYALAAHPIEVVCPRCAAHARVIADPGDDQPSTTRPRRLVCSTCGHTETWSPRSGSSWWGAAVDPFFQQPDQAWVATLPAWMKSARNRDKVLSAVTRLEARLDDPGPAQPSPSTTGEER